MAQTIAHTIPNQDLPGILNLQASVQGQVIAPDSPDYDPARMAWNLSVNQHPAVIVIAKSAEDVAAAVLYARNNNLGVAVQATGHGVRRQADGAVLILTREMTGARVNPITRTARVEAGTRWGVVLKAAQEHGLAPLLGSSPGVGAVGYTLGGGFGWLGRKYGLASDSVVSFEVVTADGRMRTVSATENSDLFWGLRGGGGALAVVTAMTIRLFPVTQVYAGNLFYLPHMAADVFRRFREWIADAPEELTASVLVMNFPPMPQIPDFLRGQSFAIVRGCFVGPVEEGEALLRHWREWQEPLMDDFKPISFADAATISNDPVDPLPGFSSGTWLSELSDGAIDVLLSHALVEGGPKPYVFAEVRHAGGAIKRVSEGEAVYGNRQAELLLSLIGVAPTPEAYNHLLAYNQKLMAALRPYQTGGVYMNFLDKEESQERIQDGLAPGGFQRLSQLKAQYDPENIFRFAFNIPPTAW